MLKDQPWMRLAKDIILEWEQCTFEGRVVEKYKDLCQSVSQLQEYQEDLALEVEKILRNAPVREDYPYEEPSDLEGILNERPKVNRKHNISLAPSQIKDKLTGAWIGRIAGCLLGKPVEGYRREKLLPLLKATNNYPMHKYICKEEFTDQLISELNIDKNACWADNLNGTAPVDDDTNYTVFALKLVETYGKDFTPDDVLEAWLTWIPIMSTCTAERVAYRNASMGLLPPDTATYKNPYREWIGAQIRGDFFGYINMGNPTAAANMAWKDAVISHVKNGIYGEMFIAAAIAVAAVCDDPSEVVTVALNEIPKNCRLARDINLVMQWKSSGCSSSEIIEKIHQAYDEHTGHGWCYTNSNAMVVVMALLCGEKDLGKSICLAVQAAFDTDCNGATVGSIVGIMQGTNNLNPYWAEKFNHTLSTTISGYETMTIENLVDKTIELL